MPSKPLIFIIFLLGCGASGDQAFGAFDESAYDDRAGGADDGGSGSGAYDTGAPPEPPEPEPGRPPAAAPSDVFVPNPDRGTVTQVTVDSLRVITRPVGVEPTSVQVTADGAWAVVLNEGSDDLTVLEVASSTSARSVGIRPNLNAMRLSGDGAWAAAWHNSAEIDRSEGSSSYNELSLVRLDAMQHWPLIVGYNPRQVRFTDDHARLLVVSDDYLCIIDLDDDEPTTRRVRISDDTVDPPAAEELLLSPDGSAAIVRQFGENNLTIVDLNTGEVEQVPVGDTPTDIDLSADGAELIAVARGSNELWIYAMDDLFASPRVIPLPPGLVFGSLVLSPDDARGVLYSSSSAAPLLAIWDRAAPEASALTVYGVVKGIADIQVTADSQRALVRHHRTSNGDLSADSPFYNREAITLLSLEDAFTNPIRLDAAPKTLAERGDGQVGVLQMEGAASVLRIDFARMLHDEVPLRSAVEHVGMMPGRDLAYASQAHDLGRISFYDTETRALQTITGFELNAAVSR